MCMGGVAIQIVKRDRQTIAATGTCHYIVVCESKDYFLNQEKAECVGLNESL